MSLKIYSDRLKAIPKAVIFDTDNTLYHYNPPHAAAMTAVEKKACQILGIQSADFQEAFAKARSETKKRLGATASSHSRLLYFQRTIEYLGMRTQLLLTLDLEQTYWRTFLSEVRLFPEVREFVQDLKSAGIKTAIITDLTAQLQFRKIIYFGLDDVFDYVVTSEEAGLDKPAPNAFNIAMEKLNTTTDETWLIGDNVKADIQGAKSFGLTALQKLHLGVDRGTGKLLPDASFSHFTELRAYFKKQGWINPLKHSV